MQSLTSEQQTASFEADKQLIYSGMFMLDAALVGFYNEIVYQMIQTGLISTVSSLNKQWKQSQT